MIELKKIFRKLIIVVSFCILLRIDMVLVRIKLSTMKRNLWC